MNQTSDGSKYLWLDANVATVTNSAAKVPPCRPRYFRDLSPAELDAALESDIPGADTEYTLRRQLEAYPTIRRENTEPSWGPRPCVPPSQS